MNKIGLIGLGKMGSNLIRNIKSRGYHPIGFDINQSQYKELNAEGIETATSIDEMLKVLEKPRYVMTLVPNGEITEKCFEELLSKLEPGDCIIEAGNSHYKDSQRRYNLAKSKQINFVDCGTSGGQYGALNGVCIMVGGEDKVLESLNDFFTAISVKDGFLHTGKPGSGHYCKMIHNGIEYGMMQAIAEGYEIMQNSEYDYDFAKVSKMWNNGSVIRSWLIELAQEAFEKNGKLSDIKGIVDMNGEGLWTVDEALKQGTPAPTIALSVMVRQRSKQDDTFSGKVLAALRNGFGGHEITKK